MSCVCGVDVGSLKTPSFVAWCNVAEKRFYLDQYIPSHLEPLPKQPPDWGETACIGFDAPQGLPAPGEKVRLADKEAKTPTNVLPADRTELENWKLYQGLIQAGVEIFWSVYRWRSVCIPGLEQECTGKTVVFETYPRYVIMRLWPGFKIPSKSKNPLTYSSEVYQLIRGLGFSCPGVLIPTHDQVDAMLCALAACSLVEEDELPSGTVGNPPYVDEKCSVLREGLIVAP